MNLAAILRPALIGCFVLASGIVATAQNTPPTMADIQKAYDAKQYADVNRLVAQAMALRGNAAVGFDREKLFVMRGESQIRLKQYTPAAEAFTSAAKETKDSKSITTYNATALLVRRSTAGKYQPKQPSTQPGRSGARQEAIDIAEPEDRKEAMNALFIDESKLATPKIEAAIKQQQLKPIVDAIKQVTDLRSLELASTGKEAKTEALFGSLGTRASELMSTAVKSMSADVERISKTANETSSASVGAQTVQIKRGLTSIDINELKELTQNCQQIITACDQLAAAMPKNVFDPVKQDATGVNNRAIAVMEADYGDGRAVQRSNQPEGGYQQTTPGSTPRGTQRGARRGQ